MSILVCGSVAYDTLLHYPGHFHQHLLSDHLHRLSVCFVTPELRREFGGCGGNIAYTLHQLGAQPLLMATVGKDFASYHDYLTQQGIRTDYIRVLPAHYTAQCFINSDQDGNQITAFHPGAMDFADQNQISEVSEAVNWAIVAPTGRAGDIAFPPQLAAADIPFIFDPGQELPLLSGEELLHCAKLAHVLTLNQYEAELFTERTGHAPDTLVGQGQLQAVVMTQGAGGSVVYLADQTSLHVAAAPISQAVDPTGCGDAFRAGVLYGLQQGWPWLSILQFASVLGAIKIEHQGGQNHPCRLPEVLQRWQSAYAEPALPPAHHPVCGA